MEKVSSKRLNLNLSPINKIESLGLFQKPEEKETETPGVPPEQTGNEAPTESEPGPAPAPEGGGE